MALAAAGRPHTGQVRSPACVGAVMTDPQTEQ